MRYLCRLNRLFKSIYESFKLFLRGIVKPKRKSCSRRSRKSQDIDRLEINYPSNKCRNGSEESSGKKVEQSGFKWVIRCKTCPKKTQQRKQPKGKSQNKRSHIQVPDSCRAG